MDATLLADLQERLPRLMLRDEQRLRRRLAPARKDPSHLAQLGAELLEAEERVEARRARVPQITYPDLPVSARREDLLAALAGSQVVIVAGETGSGKTTQLPKMLLESGRGVRGLIGHTQPRRIAARAVADRIAEELGTELGDLVGYKVRFTDKVGEDSLVKVMTDGLLLAEVQGDRDLRQYDALVVDEAHERSLNVDFLLGYLTQLLPRRPDLQLVITSATIDVERFSQHFGGAPVVEVSGRSYPVEVRYRPQVDDDLDQVQAIASAVDELQAQGPGDVLVFLSGEREIRDTADHLRGTVREGTEVLPLYARLSAAEQHRVFERHSGPRVVLATNVAETSLTVPGIRYVVDPGTARISRFNTRTKVQRLPIEAVSRASADQRKGRCGRVSAGVAIRLYSQEDYDSRPEFTDPEILRTNLASVLLQMAALGLGDIADFPFVDPPDRRAVKDGLDLLRELGALTSTGALTEVGRKLARLPLDPRLGRMVLEADTQGCVAEVLVITAALSIQDPRERPLDKQQLATELHGRFADRTSDFLTYLNLWDHLREQQRLLSGSAFRRQCRAELLHYLRIREWQDLHNQLRRAVRELGIVPATGRAGDTQVHLALLSGLLSHVGVRDDDKRDYTGARGARWAIGRSSALAKKQPRFAMAGELVETNRLWARTIARIEPEWAEQLAPDLVLRSWSEPHWSRKNGAVMGFERVTLYGVPLVARRKGAYSQVDPELCRDVFIRQALVEGDWDTHHPFLAANRALLEDAEELEHRARRRDLVVDDSALFDFYDQRVPADVVSTRHFDAWWKQARRTEPELLTFTPQMLLGDKADELREDDHPDAWQKGDLLLDLSYQFEPGAAADGVTVHIPLAVLNQVTPTGFDWQVPGLRLDLVTALIRSLPKAERVRYVPAPDTARAVLPEMEPYDGPLAAALARALHRRAGVPLAESAFDLAKVPDHLRITFAVQDTDGTVLGSGKDLEALKAQLAPRVRQTVSRAAASVERTGLTAFPAEGVTDRFDSGGVQGWPALVEEGDSVAVRVLGSPEEQRDAMWSGTRTLLRRSLPNPLKAVVGRMTNATKLGLAANPHGTVPALLEDVVTAALDELLAKAGGPVRDADGFARLQAAVRPELEAVVLELVTTVGEVLARAQAVQTALTKVTQPALAPAVADVRAQLAALLPPGFVTLTGKDRLRHLPRYLRAVEQRLERLPQDPARDKVRFEQVRWLEAEWVKGGRRPEVRWMLEELRVSLWAQSLGTAHPVSEKRILAAIDA